MNRTTLSFLSISLFLCLSFGAHTKKLLLYHGGNWIGDGAAYGPFRDEQYPGGKNPSRLELREDLHIISTHWNWIRVYGSRGITSDILQIIREDNLNIKVMLGAWISREEGFPNAIASNKEEINEAIKLANKFPDVVNSINIGNETMIY